MLIDLPKLNSGEVYAGTIVPPNENPYHLILLPGEVIGKNYYDICAWVTSVGGELPGIVDAAMLCRYLANEFRNDWYATKVVSENSGLALYQHFFDLRQIYVNKLELYSARAIRKEQI